MAGATLPAVVLFDMAYSAWSSPGAGVVDHDPLRQHVASIGEVEEGIFLLDRHIPENRY